MKLKKITPVFVEFIPEDVEPGMLYISEKYETVVHKCCCGCGEEVVTPLSPAEWHLTKSSLGVSLYPSIGNWDYRCRSHYFITDSRVVWAGPMSELQVANVRKRDMQAMARQIEQRNKAPVEVPEVTVRQPAPSSRFRAFIRKAVDWFKALFGGRV